VKILIQVKIGLYLKDPVTYFLWVYIINIMQIYQYCKFQKSTICKDITKFTFHVNKGRSFLYGLDEVILNIEGCVQMRYRNVVK
jgi:hypothetical protein